MTKTAAQIAREAAEIMSERGHCKFAEEDEQGRVCFAGAVNVAMFGLAYPRMPAASLPRAFERELVFQVARLEAGESPVQYNNRDDVTGEDVILLLKRVAERLEEEGKR